MVIKSPRRNFSWNIIPHPLLFSQPWQEIGFDWNKNWSKTSWIFLSAEPSPFPDLAEAELFSPIPWWLKFSDICAINFKIFPPPGCCGAGRKLPVSFSALASKILILFIFFQAPTHQNWKFSLDFNPFLVFFWAVWLCWRRSEQSLHRFPFHWNSSRQQSRKKPLGRLFLGWNCAISDLTLRGVPGNVKKKPKFPFPWKEIYFGVAAFNVPDVQSCWGRILGQNFEEFDLFPSLSHWNFPGFFPPKEHPKTKPAKSPRWLYFYCIF